MKLVPKNQKGFIGPIGDDLPSLIPLTVALLIFFAAFGFAFTHLEEKKMSFDQRLLLLSVGKTLKRDGLIDSFEKWETACNSLEVTRYKFRAVVFSISTNPGATFHNYEFFSDWQKPAVPGELFSGTNNDRVFAMTVNGTKKLLACDNFSESPFPFDSPSQLDEIFSSKGLAQNTLRVNFPIAVLDEDSNPHPVIRPAILAVMVWQR